MSPWVLGVLAGMRAKARRLPFNPQLGAHNVFEIPVDPELLDGARALYCQHIEPRVAEQRGAFQSGDWAFYAHRPEGWDSDISWWSAEDERTYRHCDDLFRRVQLGPIAGLLDVVQAVRLYCPLFVVRSRCLSPHFHKDYTWGCGTNAYTLMTPLEEFSLAKGGHLAYLDTWGRQRVYQYRLGTAVVFGTGFIHSAQPMPPGPTRAFLCFAFGSDRESFWPELRQGVSWRNRLHCRPSGALMRVP